MTDVNTQLLRQLPDGPVFADPTDPSYTVRFKTTTSPKSLNGAATTNFITEIIVNDNNDVTVGLVDAVDALSVRFRVSGSFESMDRLAEIFNGIAGQVSSWTSENVLAGFTPTTLPINPHA
jgi:hypothetical protein